MKRMIMILAILALASTASAFSGVVSIDSAAAKPGESVVVPVRLTGNDIKISAMLLPLRYNPAVLTLDSVSFDPSFKPSGITGYYSTDIAAKTIRIVFIPVTQTPLDTIVASSGILARLHFHVAASAVPQFTKIDSEYVDDILVSSDLKDTSHFFTRIEFSDKTGQGVFLPSFNSGGVSVLVPTAVDETNESGLPTQFALGQNYPNPFNPSTVISFDLPKAGHVHLEVYNLLGQSVGVLAEGRYPAGNMQVTFMADNLPSGIYFYRLAYDGGALTRKMMLLK